MSYGFSAYVLCATTWCRCGGGGGVVFAVAVVVVWYSERTRCELFNQRLSPRATAPLSCVESYTLTYKVILNANGFTMTSLTDSLSG